MSMVARVLRYVYPIVSVLTCLAVLAYWYWPAGHDGLDVTGHPLGRDFINNWVGPQLAFSGRISVLFDQHAYVKAIGDLFGHPLPRHNWGYPPFTLLFFWPLGRLPYFWALGIWTAALFAAFAWAALNFVAAKDRLYAAVLLVLSPACIINTIGGQNGFLTAALLLGGVMLTPKRPILAGVLFGLLTWKPQLGLVLPLALIALRAWKTILAACVTTAVLIGLSVAVLGVEPWRRYLGETSAYQLQLLHGFYGFYTFMMTSVLAEARTSRIPFQTAAILQAAVSIPVALLAAWAAPRTTDLRQRAFIFASAAPLITPYAFNYDLTALSACLVWRFVDRPPKDWSLKNLVFRLAWLAPAGLMPLNMVHVGIAPLVLIVVFGVAVWEAVARPAQARRTEPPVALAA